MDYTDVMDVLESLVIGVYKDVAENCKKEQKELGVEIKIPSIPFERITYSQCIN